VTEFETAERTPRNQRSVRAEPVRIQRRLVVGAAHDPLEAEADRVADEVMRVLQRSSTDASVGTFASSHPTRIARHAGHGDHDHGHGHGPEVGMDGGNISGELASRIQSASGGAPLGGRTLARMESGFGASFADVRVHANSPLPARVAADAFTTGTDIHFAPGLYAPGSRAGEHLLAHELTHVVQQGGAVARHVCDSACGHDRIQAPTSVHDLDVGALMRHPIAEDITPADTGYTVRRHSSWEHMLIGDLDPKSLATLGAAQNSKTALPGHRAYVGKDSNGANIMVDKEDVKHVIQQEINRLKRFQDTPPMVGTFAGIQQTEDQMKAADRQDRALDAFKGAGGGQPGLAAAQDQWGKQWDLKLLGVPNNSGQTFLVTYGEMNTLGDYFGSVAEMKAVDPVWMSKLIRGVRQSTMHELMKVYTDIMGFQDDIDYEGNVTKTKRQKSRDELGIESEDFRSATGSKDLVALGGVLNELKLMGVPPNQAKKPEIGGEPSTDYSSTLARNACHFAPESWHAWYALHTKARTIALQAHQKTLDADALALAITQPNFNRSIPEAQRAIAQAREEAARLTNEAMVHNGFGDHYMQDSYAAGHLINKTLIMQHYVQWLDKNPGKWDAHRDQNWRKMQQMAYNQPGLTDQGQYVKANVGTRVLSTGVTIGTARDPQSVENIKTGNWRTKAEALGLEVPASLNDPNARDLLVHWQEKCVTRLKVRNTRTQTWKTVKGWAVNDLHMSAQAAQAALQVLFDDGIVRMGSYSTSDWQKAHALKPGLDLTLREEYVPKNADNMRAVKGSAPTMTGMAMGVAYNDYLEFMNSAFLQKATNFVHDKFCLEGLQVKAGDSTDVFRIYGDDSMFKVNAGPGLMHSGTTSHMSRDSILSIAATGAAPQTANQILDRLPREVQLDDNTYVGLDVWHHGELLTKLEGGIFDAMSTAGKVQIMNKGVGLKPGGIGTITAGDRPGGHEVF
jgi:hypothetical protein